MTRGAARRALPLVAALSMGAVAAPAAAQERPEVEAVRFEGNETFPDDSLALAIVNRATECRLPLPGLDLLCKTGWNVLQEERRLRPRELPRDVARLELYYWQRGFREASVAMDTARTERDAVEITFRVEEGRPVLVDTLALVGAEGVDPDLLGDLPLSAGDRLSGILLEATRDTLLRRFRNSGYAYVDVLRNLFIPATSPYAAEVTYDVDPGPLSRFGPILVRWSEEDHDLSETVVRRQIPFEEGDLYSREAVFQAQRNLFSLQIVRNVRIQEDTLDLDLDGRPDSIVPVRVIVAEGDEHRVGGGVGWSTAECMATEARWTNRNFLGGARRLQVRGRLSNVLANSGGCPQAGDSIYARLNWLAAVDFNQPWLFSPRNALAASLYGERQSLPDVFVREAVGFNVAVTRDLAAGMVLGVGFRPQLSRLDAAEVFFCTSFVVCAPEDVDVLQGANWLSPLAVNWTLNRANNLINPTDGYHAFADLEYAGALTGSDFVYTRLLTEGAYYHPLGGGSVWATRLRAGWVGAGEFAELAGRRIEGELAIVHPQKRFFAGGPNSVRGFPQNRLGPRVLTVDVEEIIAPTDSAVAPACTPEEVMLRTCEPGELDDAAFFPRPTGGTRVLEANLEYRFRLGAAWEAAAFLDVGQVWAEDDPIDVGSLEWSPGVGVRYFSPVGPIRLDLGYRLDQGQRLPVVTSQIRRLRGAEAAEDAILVPGRGYYVRLDELALLEEGAVYGKGRSPWQRLQLHFSIGQAF